MSNPLLCDSIYYIYIYVQSSSHSVQTKSKVNSSLPNYRTQTVQYDDHVYSL